MQVIKAVTFLLIISFFNGKAIGQKSAKDSLLKIIHSAANSKSKLHAYIALVDKFSTQDFDSAIIISRNGLTVAASIKDSISYGVLIGVGSPGTELEFAL